MPYQRRNDLPKKILSSLPLHAQKIYMKTYNNAIEEYQNPKKIRDNSSGKKSPDITAYKVAWAAVKKKYKKDKITKNWIKK